MKKTDIDKWSRKELFKLFNGYKNPCFTINTRLDVTELCAYRERKKLSGEDKGFFIPFTYLLVKTFNRYAGFRYRIVGDEVYDCEFAKPSFTVFLKDENNDFAFVRADDFSSYEAFAREARAKMNEAIENAKKGVKRQSNDKDELDVFFISALPWLDVTEIYNPLPLEDRESLAVPRINWGKCVREGDRYKMTLSVTASHALTDGYEVCRAINEFSEKLSKPEENLV